MRDKLVELMCEGAIKYLDSVESNESKGTALEYIADYLIANGVYVLPCPIGTKVWIVNKTYGNTNRFIFLNPVKEQI
jgi:hypothetical protein